jgi:hypothetical protein
VRAEKFSLQVDEKVNSFVDLYGVFRAAQERWIRTQLVQFIGKFVNKFEKNVSVFLQ